jgi:ribosome recycling factor
MSSTFDLADIKRRMQGSIASLRHDLNGLRTGRATASLLDPVQVDAYGQHMPITQVATVSVPEPRLIAVQVWDKAMVGAVERAIRDSNLGLNPVTEGQVLRIRIPELNEQRRKELVKVAHKYAEETRVAVRHVRRDARYQVQQHLHRGGVGRAAQGPHGGRLQAGRRRVDVQRQMLAPLDWDDQHPPRWRHRGWGQRRAGGGRPGRRGRGGRRGCCCCCCCGLGLARSRDG